MGYFVLGKQGQKYGPAEIPTLHEWMGEGRILPHTVLEHDGSGVQTMASSLLGLGATSQPVGAQEPPVQVDSGGLAQPHSIYTLPPELEAQPEPEGKLPLGVADFRLALIFGFVSPILSILVPLGGGIFAAYGFVAAERSRRDKYRFGILGGLLNVCAAAFWIWTVITGFGRGVFLRF